MKRERESNKNMLTVCSVAYPERMVSILVPAVLRLAGAQKWKVLNPSMRSMWLARCCCPVHWEAWVGLPTTPLNKDTYWSPWGRSFSIFFLEFQPIICALVLQSWVQNKLLQTGQWLDNRPPTRGVFLGQLLLVTVLLRQRERETPRAESSTEQFLSCMCTSVSWQTAEQNMQIRFRCLMSRPACQRGHHQWEIQTGSGA